MQAVMTTAAFFFPELKPLAYLIPGGTALPAKREGITVPEHRVNTRPSIVGC